MATITHIKTELHTCCFFSMLKAVRKCCIFSCVERVERKHEFQVLMRSKETTGKTQLGVEIRSAISLGVCIAFTESKCMLKRKVFLITMLVQTLANQLLDLFCMFTFSPVFPVSPWCTLLTRFSFYTSLALMYGVYYSPLFTCKNLAFFWGVCICLQFFCSVNSSLSHLLNWIHWRDTKRMKKIPDFCAFLLLEARSMALFATAENVCNKDQRNEPINIQSISSNMLCSIFRVNSNALKTR